MTVLQWLPLLVPTRWQGSCASGSDTSAPDTSAPSGSATADDTGRLAWSRVDLGFVAAYVLVRGREAAVVDTGVGGSADEIGAVLDESGPGWAGVRHVVLTHKHPDHAGSLGDVLTAATRATGYVGAADLSAVKSPRRLTTVDDGDEVFGMQVVATPGHTAGHLAVFDSDTGVLVAGDALGNTKGSPDRTRSSARTSRLRSPRYASSLCWRRGRSSSVTGTRSPTARPPRFGRSRHHSPDHARYGRGWAAYAVLR